MEIFSYPENAKELYEKHKKAIEQACEPIATMLALNNPELTDLANEALELYARTITMHALTHLLSFEIASINIIATNKF